MALPDACAFVVAAADEERQARVRLDDAVEAARDAGLSLREIAELAGVTKTAIAKRLARIDRKELV